MQITEFRKIDLAESGLDFNENVYFIRINPEDLSVALKDILNELGNFSWLSKFDKDFLRASMKVNAQKTCDALKEKFYNKDGDPVISEAGEYIVSVCSKRGVVEQLGHADVPLAELLGRQKTGNPGFDFFTEEASLQLVTCGEAKYLHGKNAYGTSLRQINGFIKDEKHKSDIVLLNGLVSDNSLHNLADGKFGVCAAFSSTDMQTDMLISHICANTDFQQTLGYNYIILVAVDVI